MRKLIRVLLGGLFCVGAAAGAVTLLMNPELVAWKRADPPRHRHAGAATPRASRGAAATAEPSVGFAIIPERFEDGGYGTAFRFMAPIRDRGSLQELREAVRGRGRRGIAALRARYEQLPHDSPPAREQTLKKLSLEQSIGILYAYEGKFLEGAGWIEKALETGRSPEVPAPTRNRLKAILGIFALRRGEVENCLECIGPSSCILPIAREAVHRNQAGSRAAVKWFTEYLEESPHDLRVLWLLNIAAMTLGEHPEQVPPPYRLPIEHFAATADVGRFQNVALRVGLGARGPNLAGGSVFDDFTGDGLPDLFTTSLDADLGASLWVNRGNGTFEDRSVSAHLG